jgi:NAD(P)-dependent dehydrogenase (short-subunit alcohol dehydrogenase family)
MLAASGPPRGTASASERFAGKVSVVTGSGAGIDREIASLLTPEGARAAGVDLDLDAAEELRRATASEWAFGLDVPSEASVNGFTGRLREVAASIDVLVNNVGVEELGTIAETPPQICDEVHSVNLPGHTSRPGHRGRRSQTGHDTDATGNSAGARRGVGAE